MRLAVEGRQLATLLIAAGLAGGWSCSGSSGIDGDSSLGDERICQIAHDIAGAYNVTDTFEQSRLRVADLYGGYGKAASPVIQKGLHEWAQGMTTGDLTEAAAGVKQVSSACSAEGY